LGYSSDASNSGRAGIEKIKRNGYWAVICDLTMPGLNGIEIYHKVNALNSELSGKFILLSGSMLDQNTEAKIAEKKIRVLRKPFHFETIKELFSQLEAQVE
jgi:CheY-like chemotaxis protein